MPPRRLKGASSLETRSAVVDLIRSSGEVSRIELSEQSGLTEATISKIVRSLILDGIVVESGFGDSTGGKRPVLLTLNAASGYAIGVSLDSAGITYVVADLSGTPIDSMTVRGFAGERPPVVIQRVAAEIDTLLEKNGLDRSDVVGIGVAGAGRLDSEGGVLRSSRQAGEWEDFAIEEALRDASGLPVRLDNDANCAALGQFWSNRMPATRDFATVYMASGIGCGIVIGGDVYRGSSSNVGEIGHMILEVDGPECFCGSRGCLEVLAAPAAVVARARAAGIPQLGEIEGADSERSEPTVRSAFASISAAAAAGDDACVHLIRESADYLAKALVSLVNILDLDTVFLAGPAFASAGGIYLETVRDNLARYAFMRSLHPVAVELSDTGLEAAAVGAASVVLHGHFTPHHSGVRARSTKE
jgi:predicted NBD/HSP70 family sugar kinase